jgi:hypothetical protein
MSIAGFFVFIVTMGSRGYGQKQRVVQKMKGGINGAMQLEKIQ